MGFDSSGISELLERRVAEHMNDQPYSCSCADCLKDLDYTKTVDSDMDLIMVVSVCDCANTVIADLEFRISELGSEVSQKQDEILKLERQLEEANV